MVPLIFVYSFFLLLLQTQDFKLYHEKYALASNNNYNNNNNNDNANNNANKESTECKQLFLCLVCFIPLFLSV